MVGCVLSEGATKHDAGQSVGIFNHGTGILVVGIVDREYFHEGENPGVRVVELGATQQRLL